MPNLTTKIALSNYIKVKLGVPVVQVEVADIQIDYIIDDVVQEFQRYHYGEGNYLDYAVFNASAGTSAYSMSGLDILDVIDIKFLDGVTGINTLFSPEHILLQETGGGYFSSDFCNTGGSFGLVDYTVAMQYLKTVKDTIGKYYATNWLPGRETLLIIPTPSTEMTGLLTLYRKENMLNLINNSLVKKLAVARTRVQWGRNIGKYNTDLPGGGTTNASDIIQQGLEEEKEVMEDIRGESNPPIFFVG